MPNDNLTKKKLAIMIGGARFTTPADFKNYMRPKLLEHYNLDENLLGDKAENSDGRHDLLIYDDLTKREVIVVIGLKVVQSSAKITGEEIEKFHDKCTEDMALYGVLMTETEVHFFRYRRAGGEKDIDELPELESLNYVNYEADRDIDKRKLIDLMKANMLWVITGGVVIVLYILLQVAQMAICRNAGSVLGNINDKGDKIYYLEGDSGYDRVVIGDVRGERRFCEEKAATKKGFIHVKAKK